MAKKYCSKCGDVHTCTPHPAQVPASRTRPVSTNNEDQVRSFIATCLVKDGFKVGGAALYGAYVLWAARAGVEVMGNGPFAQAVQECGFERRLSGTVTYYGLMPNPVAEAVLPLPMSTRAGVPQFVSEACHIGAELDTPETVLYAAYVLWAALESLVPQDEKSFSNQLKRGRFTKYGSGRKAIFMGLSPKSLNRSGDTQAE